MTNIMPDVTICTQIHGFANIQILLTEALEDVFIKHHQLWCTVPLCIELISGEPVVRSMLIYRVSLNTNECHMIQCGLAIVSMSLLSQYVLIVFGGGASLTWQEIIFVLFLSYFFYKTF